MSTLLSHVSDPYSATFWSLFVILQQSTVSFFPLAAKSLPKKFPHTSLLPSQDWRWNKFVLCSADDEVLFCFFCMRHQSAKCTFCFALEDRLCLPVEKLLCFPHGQQCKWSCPSSVWCKKHQAANVFSVSAKSWCNDWIKVTLRFPPPPPQGSRIPKFKPHLSHCFPQKMEETGLQCSSRA